ncbi:retron Ec48 family effector membrane protein [Yersinia rohdei]|uniref:retron Ec48 family effector membrane protein n=1 Tax=Yersinia rohdei TaxID=29485 RepID=UPI0011AA8F89|nr:retron Ec48 family effector membrane protein [Yersinia rohdei]
MKQDKKEYYRLLINYGVILITITSLLALVMLLVLSITSAVNIYNNRLIEFCFEPKCFEMAGEIFSLPINLLKYSLVFIPVFAFCVVYKNYSLSVVNSHITNRINNERDFYAYLKECPASKDEWFSDINKKKLYRSIFDESKTNLGINEKGKSLMTDFLKFIKSKNSKDVQGVYIDPDHAEYRAKFVLFGQSFGLPIEEDMSINNLFALEKEFLNFIFDILELWFGCENEYEEIERDYAVRII